MARAARPGPGVPGRLQLSPGLVEPAHAVQGGADAVGGAGGVLAAAGAEDGEGGAVHGEGLVELAQAVVGEAQVAEGPADIGVRRAAGADGGVEEAAVRGEGLGVAAAAQELEPQRAVGGAVVRVVGRRRQEWRRRRAGMGGWTHCVVAGILRHGAEIRHAGDGRAGKQLAAGYPRGL